MQATTSVPSTTLVGGYAGSTLSAFGKVRTSSSSIPMSLPSSRILRGQHRPAHAPQDPSQAVGSGALPNKRLKLAGGDRFNGIGVLCPGGTNYRSPVRRAAGESPAA